MLAAYVRQGGISGSNGDTEEGFETGAVHQGEIYSLTWRACMFSHHLHLPVSC